ncbi:MAG: hypothetical protein M9887_10570 [Chitinophagales bacterium]|nr:hypothetical protein [Chitinophagales bacterium]
MTFKTIAKVKNGKLVVDMSEDMEDLSFEVTIESVSKDMKNRIALSHARLRKAQEFEGIFKDSNFTVNKEDVYSQ